MEPLVSVIITTKNEEQVIASCIRSIQNQTYPSIEIIIVDNHSSDHTKEIVCSFGVAFYEKGPERSSQRNYGAQKAKGKYLLFLDADMELTPRVIEEAVAMVEDAALRVTRDGLKKQTRNTLTRNGKTRIMALVIPEQSFGIGFWAACKALERSYYLGVPWIESARFFEKKAFEDIGGYDETLTGPEDFELPQRMKAQYGETAVGRISAYIRHNEGRLSLGKTLRKKYYYGKKMHEYRKKASSQGYFSKQANIMIRYGLFFRHPLRIIKHPVLFLGMLVLKTLEMGAIALGSLG